MQIALFEETGKLTSSSVYVAAMILKELNKPSSKGQATIYKLLKVLKSLNADIAPKQFFYALIFLFSTNIILFENTYIKINRNVNT